MAVTRLSGGITPANGSDPRTFPAIWNATADDIEQAEADIASAQSDISGLQTTTGTLANQSVRPFADATARDTAITSPVEGMVAYLADQDLVTVYDGSAWKNSMGVTGGILQVVQGTTTTAVTTSSATFTSTTLSASITPSSTTSKVLVFVTQTFANSVTTGTRTGVRLMRGATVLTTNNYGHWWNSTNLGSVSNTHAITFLDSPSTTSSTTYSTEFAKVAQDPNSIANVDGSPGFITLMEVAD
jgi:hypothetical protein